MTESEKTLAVALARVEEQMKAMQFMLLQQDKVLEKQDRILENLVATANQGKGALWVYTSIGGVAGAGILTALKYMLPFLK